MELALRIAYDRMGNTSPNPPVGAVIVKDGVVIARGGTGPWGTHHAEKAALLAAGPAARGADMYVSLEPCSHHGRTPPCTEAIIHAGIRKVFLPVLDPNPLVSGKGVAELRGAGVEVVFAEDMAEGAVDMLRPFRKYILRKRPFILSKSAVTLDGRIAAGSGDSKWISSEISRYLTHRIRAKVDAVIVGKNTFVRDNPSLTVRLDSFSGEARDYFEGRSPLLLGRDNFFLRSLAAEPVTEFSQPLRVVIGLPEVVDSSHNLFADGNYLIYERRDVAEMRAGKNPGYRDALERFNCRLLDASDQGEGAAAVLADLAERNVTMALLEGGGRVTGSFFDAGEIDQFLYIITPKIVGDGVPSLSGKGVDSIAAAARLRDVSVMPVGEDLFYTGYRESYHFEML
jgi:diaminohydroxyphosphoribosylaminopyrimidine deaminase/5-amino-6-(5-phosphoribosylamino)uracil reductase